LPPRVKAEHVQRRQAEPIIFSIVLIVILVIIVVGALPTWGHSRNWDMRQLRVNSAAAAA
jgi:Protein of unknown function (DUF3309)